MTEKKLFLPFLGLFLVLPFCFYAFTKLPLSGVLSAKASSYNIILVGDSMTQTLGTATPELYQDLQKYYPKIVFNIYNYGKGSTTIETLNERLEQPTTASTGDTYPPILQKDFDLIIIESYGNNPLSNHPLAEGLQIQNQMFDQAISKIKSTKPKATIVLLATLAPNRDHYAESVVNLTTEQRQQWSDERTAYIKNAIAYAQNHHLPLIDIFDKSLKNGFGDPNYINTTDFIHPSQAGVNLISQSIADFIFQNKIVK